MLLVRTSFLGMPSRCALHNFQNMDGIPVLLSQVTSLFGCQKPVISFLIVTLLPLLQVIPKGGSNELVSMARLLVECSRLLPKLPAELPQVSQFWELNVEDLTMCGKEQCVCM